MGLPPRLSQLDLAGSTNQPRGSLSRFVAEDKGLHSVLRTLASTGFVVVAAGEASWAPGEEVLHLVASEGSGETPEAEPWD